MRILGLTSIVLAAGLAFAGPAAAQNSAALAAAPVAAAPAPAPVTTPASAATSDTARPADPTLNADGSHKTGPVAGIGQPVNGAIGIQPQVSPIGREAVGFHDIILIPLILAISLFVVVLLLWVMFRYRRAANPVPSRTAHNTFIEIVWTLVPVIILVAIAIPSIKLLAHQFKPAPDNAITLKAIGSQWYWSYEYPANGTVQITSNILKEKDEVEPGKPYRTDVDGPRLLAVDNRVVLPVGVPIRLLTTSTDVIHSWAIPAFWIKLDAVPGKTNEANFTIEKPGLYFGVCSQLCGARHGYMPIAVEAVPLAEFVQWIHFKGGTMPGEASAAAPGNTAAPAENSTAVAVTTNQAAPATAAAAGHAGQ